MDRNDSGDTTLRTLPQTRSTRGVTKPKFVTYESFPAVKEKPFICELCGLRLATRESRRRHILAKHIKERTNFCSVCGKTFIFKFALKAHKAVHSDTPNFICVCGMSFTVRASYMDHIKRIHRAASEIKYLCELCFKSFGDRHTLRLHLISVHKPKTIPCIQSGCDKVFSTIGLMRSHYRYHLKQRFTCDECGQSFSTESYMYKHRLTHSGIRPHVCVDCGKTYLSVSHLNKHRRAAHSSNRPFQCSFCGKCYKTKDQLTFHESSHKGEKPFHCDICGYATAYRNTLYTHKKKHHLSSTNGVHLTGQQSLVIPNQITDSKLYGKVKNKEKVVKSSFVLKSKENVDILNEKSDERILSPLVDCDIKSLVVSPEEVGSFTVKDVDVSSLGCRSPSLNVICVVSAGNDSSELQHELPVVDKTSFNKVIIKFNTSGEIQMPVGCDASSSSSLGCDASSCSSLGCDASSCSSLGCDASSSISVGCDASSSSSVGCDASSSISVGCDASSSSSQRIVHTEDSRVNGSQNNLVPNCKSESLKLLSAKDITSETLSISEKQDPCIILSSNGKCAISTCESGDDSLLLFKFCDNSYIGLCSHHTFSDDYSEFHKDGDSSQQLGGVDFNVQCLQNIHFQTEYDTKNINSNTIPSGSSDVSLSEDTSIPFAQSQASEKQIELVALPHHNENGIMDNDLTIQQSPNLVSTVALFPSAPVDQIKSNSGEVCSTEEFSSIMELDSGAPSLSGHIVDDSFSLAQLEVLCPLCDEQFFCMDDYITHLECCHN
nr:zinc finger X-linked protein ZXDA-like [Cherax quadricarinatus]XP_053635908.1 zinc finger X-linked protein ZXDA-like [Cherax quadricarinatus]XP_053635909.1 zinc finger X-linked protein ZXDA-like [Cherax quadricarinatus]XP_053635910.1 zinc finger X-linked protein ZXDA-like [Cherax quadricarinatus]XP_053635911.1 zinc finger X-linked protein ZXDA-like [Cherax quadricarinatus]